MKRYYFAGLALGMTFVMFSTPITPEEALSRLSGERIHKLQAKSGMSLAYTAKTVAGDPAIYVFNRGEDGGYMFLGADDMAYPLLGYADEGSFDKNNIPPQMAWWLEEYARQIQYATEHNPDGLAISARRAVRVSREAIAPQIQTKWDQVAPYNSQCPLYGTQRTYTGCVATAMAQVMKYWNYPETGKGSISYDSESLGKRLSLNFSNRRLEWDKMLDSYQTGNYTDEEASAVAYLMKAAGYSVKMDYAADSSGALAMNIANGLLKYFGYDSNMTYTLRMYYSASEWEEMIYENLKNVGPILYGGGSMIGGGHSFVCDGYDGEGFFHFNWGWSGMSDGYFSLDALNPQSLGSGGGSGGGYNFTQDAVLGIQPPTGEPAEDRQPQITQMGSLGAYIDGDNLIFDLFAEEGAMWVNYNPITMKLKFGAIFEPQGETVGSERFLNVSNQAYSVAPGYGTDPAHLSPKVNLKDASLGDGTYKVTFATIPNDGDNQEYIAVRGCYGYYNYVILRKKGNEYSVEVNPVDRLAVSDGDIQGELYYGCMANVTLTVVNDNDIELTKGFAPALIKDNTLYFLGESIFVTVPPNSEITHEWATPFYQLQQMPAITADTEFMLTFFDESSYNFYMEDMMKPVVMHPVTSYPSVSLVGTPVITNATTVKENVGQRMRDVYVVKDRMNIDVEATMMLRDGVFAYNMYACACLPDWTGTGTADVPIMNYSGYPVRMEPGLETDFTTTLTVAEATEGNYYMLLIAYEMQNALIPVTGQSIVFRLENTSNGIDRTDIRDSRHEEMPVYSLQGIYLGTDWDRLPKGIYVRGGKKIIKE